MKFEGGVWGSLGTLLEDLGEVADMFSRFGTHAWEDVGRC